MFTSDDFIQEAYNLAKMGIYLSAQGEGEIAALWGGDGIVQPPKRNMMTRNWYHWLTIDARFLPHDEFALSGCLSVYSQSDFGEVAHDANAKLPSTGMTGILLYAREELLLAPSDYVCMAGSDRVKDWLRSIGWNPEWGEPRNNPDGQKIIREYRRLYFEQPIYESDSETAPYAYLGGYNFAYVDYERIFRGETFILCTLKDSEPLVEVWRDKDGSFEVVPQIT